MRDSLSWEEAKGRIVEQVDEEAEGKVPQFILSQCLPPCHRQTRRVVQRRAELKATSWTRAYSNGSAHEGSSTRAQQSNSYLYATTHGSMPMAIELHREEAEAQ